METHIWLTRLLTLNGLALYGTWETVSTVLNFIIVLQYRGGVDSLTCAWIFLTFSASAMLIMFTLEISYLARYLRYCFSPYLVMVVVFQGVVTKHFRPPNIQDYMIFTLVLLAVSVLMFLAKLYTTVCRWNRNTVTPMNVQGQGEGQGQNG